MVTTTQLPSKIIAGERTAIQTLLAKLLATYPDDILQVILFGSKARGDFTADSDTDMLVLVRHETWELRDNIWKMAARIELNHDNVVFNIQVIGEERWKEMNSMQFGMCRNVEADGIVLFRQ
ncbi:MAG: nucleotidyltransferase domain-containing protein [Chloroflexota bacterium]